MTLRSVTAFLSQKRNLVILLLSTLVIGTGEELWIRFVPKYLQAVGASVFVIGTYDALQTLLGAVYAYPGGVVVDRWGHRRAFIAFNLLSILGYLLVLIIPHWGAVILGMFLFLSWTCFSLPAAFSLIGATLRTDHYAKGIGYLAVIKRIPIMFAPIIGGTLVDRFGIVAGARLGLTISILLSSLTLLAQRQLREERTVATGARWNLRQSLSGFNPALRRLLLSDILVRFCERIPFAWVVIFAIDYVGVSARQVGLLTTVEVLTATLCIIPASHFADKHGREPFVTTTFVMFTLFPITLLFAHTFPLLIIAFAIRGLKEFGDSARKALIIVHCDAERRGQMVGAYYLVRDLTVSTGAFVGAWLWKAGPAANFLGAAAFGIIGTLLYAWRQSREPSGVRSG